MKYNTPHDFYLATNGKSVAGGQCGHLFNFFNAEQLGVQILCTDSGYVKDLWNQRATNGILDYYDIVPVNAMQDGDWVIYGECNFAPLSHVAMFRKDNGDGTGIFLQQNDSRHNPATSTGQDINPYEGIIGAFRLKQWNISTSVETPIEVPQEPIIEQPRPLQKGDKVRIINDDGRSSIYGDLPSANLAVGYEREVLDFWYLDFEGGQPAEYPYQIGNETGTTGFYKADQLERI